MKKLFSLMLLVSITFISTRARAQYVERQTVDSVMANGTQYVTFSSTKSGTTGFQLTAIKKSGTVAGTLTLEQSIDTIPTLGTRVWRQVGSQSFTLTDVATQGDIFPITVQSGNGYRFKLVTTGGTYRVYAAYLHR